MIVEAGGILFEDLLKNKLVDEIHLFKAPILIGEQGIPLINGDHLKNVKKKLLEKIKSIDIGEFFNLENFIKFFKLLPVPDMKTAVLIFLRPVNFTIKFNFIFSCGYFSDNVGFKFFCKKFSNFL